MMAAVKTVRKQHPSKLVAAVPVGAPGSCAELRQYADEVVSLLTPRQFYAVHTYYYDFQQVDDAEVLDLLEQSQHWLLPAINPPKAVDAYAAHSGHPSPHKDR